MSVNLDLVQLGILSAQALALALLVISLFAARRWLGIAPLCMSLAVLQQAQALTGHGGGLDGLPVSPGAAVFFTASLFAVLLIYVREDRREAGKLALGLAVANAVSALVMVVVGFQPGQPGALLADGPGAGEALGNARFLLVSGALLLLGSLLTVALYRRLDGVIRSPFLRASAALVGVLVLDAALFAGLLMRQVAGLGWALGATILAKLVLALFFAATLAVYLRLAGRVEPAVASDRLAGRALTHLSYREKFELARRELRRDALTGLYNRGYFDEYFPDAMARAELEERPISLLLVDLDHFKSVNDRFGHAAGDAALRAVADALLGHLRPTDRIFRYGGEEFAVVLPDTGPQDARRVAERVRALLDMPAGGALPAALSATLGVASAPEDGLTPDALFAAADKRLYQGKREGRNRVVDANLPSPSNPAVVLSIQRARRARRLQPC